MTLALYGKSRRRQALLLAAAVLAIAIGAMAVVLSPAMPGAASSDGPGDFHHEGDLPITWGEGFEIKGDCGPYSTGDGYVWHFVVTAQDDLVSLSGTFASAGVVQGVITDAGNGNPNKHGWIVTPTQDTLTAFSVTTDPAGAQVNLSHFCDASDEPDPEADLQVEKVVVGDSDDTTFTGTVTGLADWSLQHGQDTGSDYFGIDPDEYTVAENDPGEDWELLGYAIVNIGDQCPAAATTTDASVNVELEDGDAIKVCVYNEADVDDPGTGIIIRKATTPPGGEGFTFSQDIDDTGNFTLGDGDFKHFQDLEAGLYEVAEIDMPENWSLLSIQCTGDQESDVTVSLATAQVTIDLATGETVDCTFTNEETPVAATGNLFIEKFDHGDGSSIEWDVTITGPEFPGGQLFTIPAGGQLFPGIEPGDYTVSEATVEGWSPVETFVNGVSQGAATTVDVTVVEDATVTVEVEFRNELDPTPTPPVETPTPPVETPTPPVETPTPPVETPTPPPPGTLIIHKVITNLGEEGTDDASEDDEFVATVNGTGATFSMANPATVDGLDAGGYTVTEHLNDEDDYFVVGWALAVDGICPAEPTSAEGAASANVTVVSGAATEVCFYNTFIVEEELPDVTTPTPTPAPEETPAPPDAGSGMTQGPAGSQVMLVAMALLSISTGAMLLTLGRRRMTAA